MKRLFSAPVLVGGLAALAAIALAAFVLVYQTRQQELGGAASSANVQIGGAFEMQDQFGNTVTQASFPDKFKLVYFGYSFCPDVCPTDLYILGQAMASLEETAPELANQVQPVFVTVDPGRDRPEVLKEFVVNFHDRMIGLSGDDQATASMAKAYRIYYNLNEPDADGDYLVDHSALTYLMGPDGLYRTHFGHGSDPEKMAETIRKIIRADRG
ncbi:SCO family protein [Aestuariispira insulae]|nr:SCO family protein [Aestuariispira insulae]